MTQAAPRTTEAPARRAANPGRDRSLGAAAWYRLVQIMATQVQSICGGLRATGRHNVPESGGAILVSNHLSHLDVFMLGLPLPRPLNYVARSTLFQPGLGFLIRSVGGFAIQREGRGSEGFKETLRRVRAGGIVTFFPEGTRSPDGELGELKPGIVAIAGRAGVPIIPAGLAGSFEAWPRNRLLPGAHPIRVHYGKPIQPEELAGLSPEQVVGLIRSRMLESRMQARRGLWRDLGGLGFGPGT